MHGIVQDTSILILHLHEIVQDTSILILHLLVNQNTKQVIGQ